jgi:hypothetical protein
LQLQARSAMKHRMSQGPASPTGAAPHGPRMLVIAAVHVAVVVASWLFASLLYAVVVARSRQLGWIAVDAAVIALCGWFVHARPGALGFRALGPRRGAKLLAIVLWGTACTLIVQLLVRDRNGVWLDESNYLATVRAGHILRDGLLPFNMRWLMPMLAGRWNILPVDDMDALKALNFGGFAVTAAFLVLLLARLRVPLGLAIAAPVFLLCSYLGIYGASNRLVIDAFNYAMYVLLFHLVIRREHAAMFGAVLLMTSWNSEKAICWIPVFALVALLRDRPAAGGAWRWFQLHRHPTARLVVWCCAPALLYLVAMRLYLAGSNTDFTPCVENIDVLSLSALGAQITDKAVKVNTFQNLWLPFGPFTIYALLGFTLAERWLRPVALLIIPILIQSLLACDGDRMVAYAFIVYLPFGYLYLTRAFTDMPRGLARLLFGLVIALTVAERYALPVVRRFRAYEVAADLFAASDLVKLIFSATELALVGTILFVHFTFFYGRHGRGA